MQFEDVLLNFTRNCDVNEYIAIKMTHVLRQSEETHTTDEPVDAHIYSFQSQIRSSKQMRDIVFLIALFVSDRLILISFKH